MKISKEKIAEYLYNHKMGWEILRLAPRQNHEEKNILVYKSR